MLWLVLGLIIFLGSHSVRIVAEPWRQRTVARLGPNGWKAAYSIVSLLGLVVIVWGFAQARQQPVVVWHPPALFKPLNSLATLIAFVLIVAAYVPRNHFRQWLHHPMTLGVLLWALGHLLATVLLADLVLFGAFALWAACILWAACKRDRVDGTTYAGACIANTLATLLVGAAVWAVFALWAHGALIGVPLF